MATGENYTAGHSIFTPPDPIGRAEVSPARDVQTVRAQVTVHPAKKAQKNPCGQYGKLLICVRYRYDAAQQRRLNTVELIVEEES
jgi:hypothetical protein